MSDATEAGRIIGDHWNLIGVLFGVLGGAITVGVSVIVYTSRIMDAIDRRISEKIMLALSNGAGDRVAELVALGVAKAFHEHTLECPVRPRVDMNTKRLENIERKLIGLVSEGQEE